MVELLIKQLMFCEKDIFYIKKIWNLKDKSKVWGDFLTQFLLKLTENDDIGVIVIWGL